MRVWVVFSFRTSILATDHSNNTLPTGGTMMVSTKAMISHTMCGLDKVTMGCLVFEAALMRLLVETWVVCVLVGLLV